MSQRSWFHLPEKSRRRLWMLYHVAFVLLVAHMALVYLMPGFFYNPQQHWRQLLTVGQRGQTASFVVERDGDPWLRGGANPEDHFNISQFHLDPDRLKYGIGREHFPALTDPKFVPAEQADEWLRDDDRVLAVRIGDTVRVHPVELLLRHEVVNDEIDGVPYMAAYCVLADLGAVYDRRLGEHTLTFALSGYTYSEPGVWNGRDAFVLWDRETESLWWPPVGKAVSGPLIHHPLTVLDHQYWSQTTWGAVRTNHPEAEVLKPGQDFTPPADWPGLLKASRIGRGGGISACPCPLPVFGLLIEELLVAVGGEPGLLELGLHLGGAGALLQPLGFELGLQVAQVGPGRLQLPAGVASGQLDVGVGKPQDHRVGLHLGPGQQDDLLHLAGGASRDCADLLGYQRAGAAPLEQHLAPLDVLDPQGRLVDRRGGALQLREEDGDRHHRDDADHPVDDAAPLLAGCIALDVHRSSSKFVD